MARPLARDAHGIGTLGALAALLVVLAIMFAAYYVFVVPAPPAAVLRVEHGDQVSVDYIGYFQDTGLVFDTSNESVARDNATWPKAVSFRGMPAGSPWPARWTPPRFDIGQGAQRAVPGFEQGLLGLATGEGKAIVTPFELAYGPMDTSLIQVKPLLEDVPVRTVMNASAFRETYGSTPVSGTNVTDPFWKWDASVSVAGTIVTVTNSPTVRQVVRPYDRWDARVVSIDDPANGGEGVVRVRHLLDESMEDRVGWREGDESFYLSDVDSGAGTYTLNYNTEVVGRTLVFIVKMLGIFRA